MRQYKYDPSIGDTVLEIEEDVQEDFDYYYDLQDGDEDSKWSEMSYNVYPLITDHWNSIYFESEEDIEASV